MEKSPGGLQQGTSQKGALFTNLGMGELGWDPVTDDAVLAPFCRQNHLLHCLRFEVQRNNFVTVIKKLPYPPGESLWLHNVGLVTTKPRFFTPDPQASEG